MNILGSAPVLNLFLAPERLKSWENEPVHISDKVNQTGGKWFLVRITFWSLDIKILSWCPVGLVLPHGEKVPL